MLTEYSTYDDIRKFRDKAWEKFNKMYDGWLHSKIYRQTLEWHRHSDAVKKGRYKSIYSDFTVDNQVVRYNIAPQFNRDGTISKELFGVALGTEVPMRRRTLYYRFNGIDIEIMTTHYLRRFTERSDFKYRIPIKYAKVARYRRDGEIFEYLVFLNYIMITKRLAPDILFFKTFLHRDIITGRNHKELIARAERGVDYDDIYEWK